MQIVAKSDVGLVRKRNEDFYVVEPDHHLVVVCDGMGGHPGGHIASRMAAEEIRNAVVDGLPEAFDMNLAPELPPALQPHENLLKGVFWADRQLREYGKKNREYEGMGTTVVAVEEKNGTLCVVHVGDSRVYCHEAENLKQVTQDHSVVATNPEYANFVGMKNILTRAMGVGEQLEVDFALMPLRSGASYLLCTDGLTNYVTESLMAEVLGGELSAPEKVDKLIEEAKKGGGGDNITMALAVVDKDADQSSTSLMGSVVQNKSDLRVKVGQSS